MLNIEHIMPNPRVVPIFWGSEYLANPQAKENLIEMVADIATGTIMNGLIQYGVGQATLATPVFIDDANPPATLVYTDDTGALVDDITKKLVQWIDVDHLVPAPSSNDDVNTVYLIVPSIKTIVHFFNGENDKIGNGVQGFHNEGQASVAAPPTYYWAIVKTQDALDPVFVGDLANAEAKDGALDFVGGSAGVPNGGAFGIAQKIYHELAEQFVDRNGTFLEVGDDTTRNPCNDTPLTYRRWIVQKYQSVWDGGCADGRGPISLSAFLHAIGFDFSRGLRGLATNTVSREFIAATMRTQPAPDTTGL